MPSGLPLLATHCSYGIPIAHGGSTGGASLAAEAVPAVGARHPTAIATTAMVTLSTIVFKVFVVATGRIVHDHRPTSVQAGEKMGMWRSTIRTKAANPRAGPTS